MNKLTALIAAVATTVLSLTFASVPKADADNLVAYSHSKASKATARLSL